MPRYPRLSQSYLLHCGSRLPMKSKLDSIKIPINAATQTFASLIGGAKKRAKVL